jgi:hypothetical protein
MYTFTIADIQPCDEDVALGLKSLSTLFGTRTKNYQIDLHDDNGSVLSIPKSTLFLLQEMLAEISKGNILSIIPPQAELTTLVAADILDVPLSLLTKLIEAGKIPVCKADTCQRILYRDVIDYKRRMVAKRLEALDELAAQGQELGMGY